MAMAIHHLLILLSLTFLIPTNSHNITAVLDAFRQYSVYNSYLSQTKLCDEINSHETVTCLVLSNPVMSSLAAKKSLSGIKNALRLLSLLDYFDIHKLHDLTRGTTALTTTLYQTSGNAPFNLGFVNITRLIGGRVGFASARPGSAFDAVYTKSVLQIPYNLSVLEVSALITFPGLMDAPPAPSNLTDLLEKAGCKIFASLITSTGVLKMYQSAMDKGFTLFAPKDDAFKADGVPDLTTLSRTDLVTILQYHALPSYTPKASLKAARGLITTMASSGSGKYVLSVTSHGFDVSLHTGIGTSHIASSVLDDTPVCILTVESLLLPSELFNAAPGPGAPSPVSLMPSDTPTTAPVTGTEAPLPHIDKRRPPPVVKPPPQPRPPTPPMPNPRSPPPPDHGPYEPPAPSDPFFPPWPPFAPGPDDPSEATSRSVVFTALLLVLVCMFESLL